METLHATLLVSPPDVEKLLQVTHKGGAAIVEYTHLSDLAHQLEDFFLIIKVGKVKINEEIKNHLLLAVDCLKELVNLSSQPQEIPPMVADNIIANIYYFS
ncbi:MAG TPA: Hpt domain-containing protein [Geminocystis sp. M7585_C2015_104]|nr:Hpt domain-containing protein [Geminocystis sp. M7585_C2015_104]